MADQTRLYARQPNGRLAYFLAGPGRFNAGEVSPEGEYRLMGEGYSEAPPEVFARQRRGYEQDMPGTPADSPMLPKSNPAARPLATLPAGASRVATRALDGTVPYFHASDGYMEEGRLPAGEDPSQLADQGYVFADADAYNDAHARLDPMRPVQDKGAEAAARSAEDDAVDSLAREMDRPYPKSEDSPEDVDALAKAFDSAMAPRAQPASAPVSAAPRHPGVSVQRVPTTVALASPLGGTPLPRPVLQGATAAQEGIATSTATPEETLADVQARADRQRALAGLARAGSRMGAALANVKPESGPADELEQGADRTVAEYLQRKQAAEAEKQKAEQDALKDPTSPQSKRFQEVVARTFGGIYTPEQISHMTAADKDQIFDAGRMRATLDERAQQAKEERASREQIAADNRDARKEEARQRALDRGLARELAKTKASDAATQKAQALSFSHEDALRKELASNPATKQFQDVSTAFDKVTRAAKDPSAAGDMAMIFGYMKMLDPNSSVREGEYATAANAGNIGDAMIARYNSVINGQKLSPDQRADFLRRAREAYDAQKSTYDRVANQYRGIAASAGVAPERVAMPLGLDLNAPSQPTAQQKTTPEEDEKALAWARANPKDPRAARILRSHGVNL